MSSATTQPVNLKVFRFNKETDYLPYYQDFALTITHETVLLDALNEIKWHHDGTLSYRRSCRHGICGICSIKVNGKAVLACKERMFDLIALYGNELTIEPLNTKRAIKDMIIDKEDFWQNHAKVKPFVETAIDEAPTTENLVSPAQEQLLLNADYCIQCGACHYSCPSVEINERYIGPAAFAAAYRFNADVRDEAKQARLETVNAPVEGVWDCVKCMECAEVCPKEVNPIEKITKLHNQVFEEGVAINNIATRHAVYFKDSIKKSGNLNEAGLVIYSEKGYGMYKHWKVGMKMIAVGKAHLNPFVVPQTEKVDEIQKLIESSSTAKF